MALYSRSAFTSCQLSSFLFYFTAPFSPYFIIWLGILHLKSTEMLRTGPSTGLTLQSKWILYMMQHSINSLYSSERSFKRYWRDSRGKGQRVKLLNPDAKTQDLHMMSSKVTAPPFLHIENDCEVGEEMRRQFFRCFHLSSKKGVSCWILNKQMQWPSLS